MRRKTIITVLGVILFSAAGLGLGIAFSALANPAASNQPGSAAASISAPKYPTNARGDSYGSAAQAASPEQEPDLLSVVATNGVEGFVRKTELDEANGASALASFTTPEDAIRWQEEIGSKDRTIMVYSVDGVTQVGTFTITGSSSTPSTDPDKK